MNARALSPGLREVGVLGLCALAIAILPCCSDSDDNDSGGGGGGDMTPPTASASPGTSTFAGASLDVTLSASDNSDPSPVIYYTTDATIPTDMSTMYTGPITLTDSTILRFIAVDADDNTSDVELRGYTQTDNPFAVAWATSGHGDIVAEAFRHWDEDGDVSTSCARCHAGEGFVDYAEDGTTDMAAALPVGHDCDTCHTTAPLTRYGDLLAHPALEPVEFPSGGHASLWGDSNMCLVCHQGRSSTVQVDSTIAGNPGGPYTFINIHYYAAAASYFGAETTGAYQYEGEDYAGRNIFPSHPPELQTCVGCHMRGANADHTLEPLVADCTGCHAGSSFEDLSGSPGTNHDAIDAATTELLAAIQDYATNEIGEAIAYDPSGYPYFFKDLNGNGVADPDEANYGNRYDQFDESLLKAAYNYQVSAKDPAGFIHNGTYMRQALHDSIVDLGAVPSTVPPGRPGFDDATANESEQWHASGHADSSAEAFRHWDEDGEVSTSCARCHSGAGFIDFVEDGTVDAPAPLGDLVSCSACHVSDNLYVDSSTRYDDLMSYPALDMVEFPSGATADMGNAGNMCMVCHQGRESGVSVDANSPNSTVQSPVDYDSFNFINRHYFAAAAIFLGSDVTAAYEYAGQVYKPKNDFTGHMPELRDCIACHMRGEGDHHFVPPLEDCTDCHTGIASFEELGFPFGNPNVDYDGDGTGESFQHEIDGMAEQLYAAIQNYAVTGLPQSSRIVYGPHSYPYWFKDSNGDGMLTEGEASYPNRYTDFDRTMLRAAFNYHSAQDPASDIHHHQYVLQTLYDSIDDLDDGMFNNSPMGTRP